MHGAPFGSDVVFKKEPQVMLVVTFVAIRSTQQFDTPVLLGPRKRQELEVEVPSQMPQLLAQHTVRLVQLWWQFRRRTAACEREQNEGEQHNPNVS